MTVGSQAAFEPVPAEVGRWLSQQGLATIVVIDDEFDRPRWDQLSRHAREGLERSVLLLDESLHGSIKERGLLPPDSVAAPEAEDYLFRLNKVRTELHQVDALWREFVNPELDKNVQALQWDLEALENVGVVVGGLQSQPTIPQTPLVLFIDYALDAGDQGDAAINLLREIYRERGEAPRPVVVLMSSRPLGAADIDRFREATGTMPGMFHWVPKHALERVHLYAQLAMIAPIVNAARHVQAFTDAVADAVCLAAMEVAKLVRELTVEDHAFLQLLSLHADGHPLGDYVLWLVSAHFRDQLSKNEGVVAAQGSIDAAIFATLPVTTVGPSDAFARVYNVAVFAPPEPDILTRRYPELSEEASRQSGVADDVVCLHFGDLFVEPNERTVYMVATPECDLAFGGPRAFPHGRSVVLIPGTMERSDALFEKRGENRVRTELFMWQDQRWRIEWRLKQAQAVRLSQFRAWLRDNGIKHGGQIRFEFAADIQRSYAADLTRVGLPVSPPLVRQCKVSVYTSTPAGKPYLVCQSATEGGYIFSSARYQKYVVADGLLRELREKMHNAIDAATTMPGDEEVNRIPELGRDAFRQKARERVKKYGDPLRDIAVNMPTFLALRGPFEHDFRNDGLVHKDAVVSVKNGPPKNPNRFEADTALLICFEAQGADDDAGMEVSS